MRKLPTDTIPHGVPDSSIVHVVPQNDLREHECCREDCWCNPTVEEEGMGYVVVHKSLDGRELFELSN